MTSTDIDAYKLETTPPGIVQYETSQPGNGYIRLGSTATVYGAWHHVATTWDGMTKRLYIDGALENSNTIGVEDSTRPIELGADIDFGVRSNFYLGSLDDVCFWNRALADADVVHLAAQ
jgi:hypothetical protein